MDISKQIGPNLKKKLLDRIDDDLLAYLLGNHILEQFLVGMSTELNNYILLKRNTSVMQTAFTWITCNDKCREIGVPEVNWVDHARIYDLTR